MEPLLVYPYPVPADLAQALGRADLTYIGVRDELEATRKEPENGWRGAVLVAEEDPDAALALAKVLRDRDYPLEPLMLVLRSDQLPVLEGEDGLFDDFVLAPLNHRELAARIRRQFVRLGRAERSDLVVHGDLVLNLETYQAAIARTPLTLTYMEYELLKFLAQHPGKVFTREALLNRVWGYEYYGGARTVDVHVRRLRAKLGEEHANLIQTVRSVGYRFGQTRWSS